MRTSACAVPVACVLGAVQVHRIQQLEAELKHEKVSTVLLHCMWPRCPPGACHIYREETSTALRLPSRGGGVGHCGTSRRDLHVES